MKFPWSRSKKGSPEQPVIDSVTGEPVTVQVLADRFSKVMEILEAHQTDLTTINTAINRIERKQNRWLEVLNQRDILPAESSQEKQALTIDDRLEGLAAGQETEF